MATNIKGWFTINGVHVPIMDGQSKGSAYKNFIEARNRKYPKAAGKAKDKKSMKSIDRDQYYAYRKEKLDNINKLEEDYKAKIEDLKKSKLSDDDKWQKEIELDKEFTKAKKQEGFMYVMDSKADKFMLLDNDDVFESKRYKINEKHESKDISKLTPEEKQSLTNYTSQWGYGNYQEVNGLLYEPNKSFYGDGKAKSEAAIKSIDSAMNKCTLGQDCQVYRGIEASKLNNEQIAKVVTKFNKAAEKGTITGLDKNIKELESLKGTTIDNKGYMSTSTALDPNYMQRGVTLVINAKASDKAIHIQSLSKYGGKQDLSMAAFSKGPVQHEDEILFNRNTKLKIVDVAVTRSGVQLLCDTE